LDWDDASEIYTTLVNRWHELDLTDSLDPDASSFEVVLFSGFDDEGPEDEDMHEITRSEIAGLAIETATSAGALTSTSISRKYTKSLCRSGRGRGTRSSSGVSKSRKSDSRWCASLSMYLCMRSKFVCVDVGMDDFVMRFRALCAEDRELGSFDFEEEWLAFSGPVRVGGVRVTLSNDDSAIIRSGQNFLDTLSSVEINGVRYTDAVFLVVYLVRGGDYSQEGLNALSGRDSLIVRAPDTNDCDFASWELTYGTWTFDGPATPSIPILPAQFIDVNGQPDETLILNEMERRNFGAGRGSTFIGVANSFHRINLITGEHMPDQPAAGKSLISLITARKYTKSLSYWQASGAGAGDRQLRQLLQRPPVRFLCAHLSLVCVSKFVCIGDQPNVGAHVTRMVGICENLGADRACLSAVGPGRTTTIYELRLRGDLGSPRIILKYCAVCATSDELRTGFLDDDR
jgi:hypothetical protein